VCFFPFVANDRRRKLHRDRRKKLHKELFFLLLPGRGGGSYRGNGQCCFSFCYQGEEEEVTQGTGSVVFPFAARDRRRKLHRERAVLFFLLLLEQEEEITQGTGSCQALPTQTDTRRTDM